MMIYSIISDFDIFFDIGQLNEQYSLSDPNKKLSKNEQKRPSDFFSTDPKDYLRKSGNMYIG